MKKIILSILITIGVVVLTFIIYNIIMLYKTNYSIDLMSIKINDQNINYEAKIKLENYDFFRKNYTKKNSDTSYNEITTTNNLSLVLEDSNYKIKIELNGKIIYDDIYIKDITYLLKNDEIYNITIYKEVINSQSSKTLYSYNFDLKIIKKINILYDDKSYKEGDLINININNVKEKDSIKITSSISDVTDKNIICINDICNVYIPIMINGKVGNHYIKIFNNDILIDTINLTIENIDLISYKIAVSDEKLPLLKSKQDFTNLISSTIKKNESLRSSNDSFILPITSGEIISSFNDKMIINDTNEFVFNSGINIKGNYNQDILSSSKGKVLLAQKNEYAGNFILIDHGNNIYSLYTNLSVVNVKPNDLVKEGSVIGTIGNTGFSYSDSLHFEIILNDVYINPLSVLKK